jgi:hypothetical protein
MVRERVNFDLNRLFVPHLLELCLLEVRNDPHVVIDNREKRLAHLKPLAYFN